MVDDSLAAARRPPSHGAASKKPLRTMRIDIELSPEFHTTRINFRAMERLAMREAGLQVRPTGLMSITSSPFQMLCAMLLW